MLNTNLMTVTVLYYADEDLFTLRSKVLADQPVSSEGRPIFNEKFREGKTIIAVLKGAVEVVNSLGQRFETNVKAI
ncbi:hypothetical protein GCM10011607_28840 [Shewanella inventionis]|uniref:DUF2375 domain-containing protein n=1 Tax=Shewanella inventionis TaxID=1738770 RepID=A0ABQ1JDU1_9GAMM|nr:DUF2375 family protein [Shewanella inventionis]GGB66449.1 hypothetical protein GCM10011607_28840 [Shewanella inventionis]